MEFWSIQTPAKRNGTNKSREEKNIYYRFYEISRITKQWDLNIISYVLSIGNEIILNLISSIFVAVRKSMEKTLNGEGFHGYYTANEVIFILFRLLLELNMRSLYHISLGLFSIASEAYMAYMSNKNTMAKVFQV